MIQVVRAPAELGGSGDGTTTTAPPTEGPPVSDVEGEDVPGLPRYPGSVRIDYFRTEQAGSTSVGNTYLTGASRDEVVEYFEGTLPEADWTINAILEQNGESILNATREAMTLQLVVTPSKDFDGYTEIGAYVLVSKE